MTSPNWYRGMNSNSLKEKELSHSKPGDRIKRKNELDPLDKIVGESEVIETAKEQARRVAPLDTTVLILGETGTGKELFAHGVHLLSRRSSKPLVRVNCAGLPSGLIESELFGHERGAFTGAVSRKAGRFEIASGGTIYLDEIGDLSLEVQAKLLRVLQEHEFERLGGNKTIQADVRIMAATNKNLAKGVRDGTFRADLFYRLNVFPILLPPLRGRKEDILFLGRYFLNRFKAKYGKRIRKIERSTLRLLKSYPWPGNVRELANIMERTVILTDGPVLEIDETFMPFGDHQVISNPYVSVAKEPEAQSFPVKEKSEFETKSIKVIPVKEPERLLASLRLAKGNRSEAAKILGMGRTTLWRKLKTYNIASENFK